MADNGFHLDAKRLFAFRSKSERDWRAGQRQQQREWIRKSIDAWSAFDTRLT